MDNAAFMDDFFCQVSGQLLISVTEVSFFRVKRALFFAFQIEDIRNSIDKIDENVSEVKKLYSVILSAPTSEQSKMPPHFHLSSHNSSKFTS